MDLEDFLVVTGLAEEQLNEKQLLDYRQYREDFLSWSLAVGKNPMKAEGYSRETVRRTGYRTDHFTRCLEPRRTLHDEHRPRPRRRRTSTRGGGACQDELGGRR